MRQKEYSLAVVVLLWSVLCVWSVLERSLFVRTKQKSKDFWPHWIRCWGLAPELAVATEE